MPERKQSRELSESEFERVFREVRADISSLQLSDKVFGGVVDNLRRYPRLASNFPGFFSAFYAAMQTDFIIRLGRIYDPEGSGRESCTLARCLRALRDNPQFFTDPAIITRLNQDYRRANPNYLSFHRPDLEQINADLDKIGRSRGKLINLRHKWYAHKDLETTLGKRHEFLSSHDEVKELTALAHEIWNRHSLVWNASTYSGLTIGEDDYKWLFRYLRRGMKVKSLFETRRLERLYRRRIAISQRKQRALAVQWKRARLPQRGTEVGHGFCIYAGSNIHSARLVAFVEGFKWYHGGDKAIIRFDPRLVPRDKQRFAAFKTTVEARIRTNNVSPSEIAPGYWGIANA